MKLKLFLILILILVFLNITLNYLDVKSQQFSIFYILNWLFMLRKRNEKDKNILFSKIEDIPLKPNKSIRLVFIGDVFILKNYPFNITVDKLLNNVYKTSDLTAFNLESTLNDKYKTKILIHEMSYKNYDNFIKAHKFNQFIVNIANNHIYDKSKKGFVKTLKYLKNNKYNFIGDNTKKFIKIFKLNNIKLAIVSWTHWDNYMTFYRGIHHKVLRYTDIINIDWERFKDENEIDFLIGLPHWGIEFNTKPCKKIIGYTEYLYRLGFNILVGNHQHIVQKFEKRDNKHFVSYSLGNYCIDGPNLNNQWNKASVLILDIEKSNIKPYLIKTTSISNNTNIKIYNE